MALWPLQDRSSVGPTLHAAPPWPAADAVAPVRDQDHAHVPESDIRPDHDHDGHHAPARGAPEPDAKWMPFGLAGDKVTLLDSLFSSTSPLDDRESESRLRAFYLSPDGVRSPALMELASCLERAVQNNAIGDLFTAGVRVPMEVARRMLHVCETARSACANLRHGRSAWLQGELTCRLIAVLVRGVAGPCADDHFRRLVHLLGHVMDGTFVAACQDAATALTGRLVRRAHAEPESETSASCLLPPLLQRREDLLYPPVSCMARGIILTEPDNEMGVGLEMTRDAVLSLGLVTGATARGAARTGPPANRLGFYAGRLLPTVESYGSLTKTHSVSFPGERTRLHVDGEPVATALKEAEAEGPFTFAEGGGALSPSPACLANSTKAADRPDAPATMRHVSVSARTCLRDVAVTFGTLSRSEGDKFINLYAGERPYPQPKAPYALAFKSSCPISGSREAVTAFAGTDRLVELAGEPGVVSVPLNWPYGYPELNNPELNKAQPRPPLLAGSPEGGSESDDVESESDAPGPEDSRDGDVSESDAGSEYSESESDYDDMDVRAVADALLADREGVEYSDDESAAEDDGNDTPPPPIGMDVDNDPQLDLAEPGPAHAEPEPAPVPVPAGGAVVPHPPAADVAYVNGMEAAAALDEAAHAVCTGIMHEEAELMHRVNELRRERGLGPAPHTSREVLYEVACRDDRAHLVRYLESGVALDEDLIHHVTTLSSNFIFYKLVCEAKEEANQSTLRRAQQARKIMAQAEKHPVERSALAPITRMTTARGQLQAREANAGPGGVRGDAAAGHGGGGADAGPGTVHVTYGDSPEESARLQERVSFCETLRRDGRYKGVSTMTQRMTFLSLISTSCVQMIYMMIYICTCT